MQAKKIISILTLISFILTFVFFMISPHRLKRLELYAMYHGLISKEIREHESQNLSRGKITLYNGKVLAYDTHLYKALILSKIDALTFARILSDVSKVKKINKERILNNISRGNLYNTITYTLNEKQAQQLKYLALGYDYLYLEDSRGEEIYHNILQVQYSGTKRVYPYKDFLTPIIGYIRKNESPNGITYTSGVKGIEKSYNKYLLTEDKVVLNIDFKMQKELEDELDNLKLKDDLYEASSVVLDLDNGMIRAFASSNRYNPNAIKAREIEYLNSSVLEYLFNLGDLFTPISNAMEIKSEQKFSDITKNLKKFGLLSKSNIDIPFEQKSLITDNDVKVNFFKVLRVYSIFYNNGLLKEYRLANRSKFDTKTQVITPKKVNEIRETLPNFYKEIENKEFDLEFEKHTKKATMKFKYFEIGKERYLRGDFIIKKKENFLFSNMKNN